MTSKCGGVYINNLFTQVVSQPTFQHLQVGWLSQVDNDQVTYPLLVLTQIPFYLMCDENMQANWSGWLLTTP